MSRLFIFQVAGTQKADDIDPAARQQWKVTGGTELPSTRDFHDVIDEILGYVVRQLMDGKAQCDGPYQITRLLIEEVHVSTLEKSSKPH